GRFLVERAVDGRTLWGGETEDGGFISQDGTVYVDPSGKVAHGLTAPDGRFLPDGASRVVDGHTVWGSVGDDGSFLSEDGTVFVTAGGHVEHGKVVDGRFLVERAVDGRTLWGGETEDGGFISQDGTIYVDAKGKVQKGITDPVSGSFVPGGIAYKMPDGSTAYGAMIGDTFFVANGTTIVLHNGTVLHGTTNWTTGIFTTGSGDSYFVGEDGVTHGKFRNVDGAFVLDDGKVVMTPKSWTVDLAQMAEAITFVKSQYDLIDTYRDTISGEIGKVESAWTSPASASFTDTADKVKSALSNLYWLVGGIVDQLQQTYDNYVQAEQAANKNLSQ
ncbi:WXG100 family type VII secretion target, partial [Actinacidiphila cocklensis]|uniref:WXG100 family type VII secretion target n=1 Tax=Actinacidiphila cocklensis TaxID=887465 RepID=UPI00203CAFB6